MPPPSDQTSHSTNTSSFQCIHTRIFATWVTHCARSNARLRFGNIPFLEEEEEKWQFLHRALFSDRTRYESEKNGIPKIRTKQPLHLGVVTPPRSIESSPFIKVRLSSYYLNRMDMTLYYYLPRHLNAFLPHGQRQPPSVILSLFLPPSPPLTLSFAFDFLRLLSTVRPVESSPFIKVRLPSYTI
jgi:hypothetical protein